MARHHMWFSVLDLVAAFNVVRVKPGQEYLLAFKTSLGMYEYTGMPFGVTNGPSTFQRYIDKLLIKYKVCCAAYLNDIIIVAESEEQCTALTKEVIALLKEEMTTINLEKSQMISQDVRLLGVRVTNTFVEPILDIETICNWPKPAKWNSNPG